MRFILFVITVSVLIGCSSKKKPVYYSSSPSIDVSDSNDKDDNIDESIVFAQRRALDRLYSQNTDQQEVSVEPKQESVGLKEVQHKYLMDTKNHLPKVKKWIKYYSEKDRKRFQRFLNRGARYKQIVQDLLVTNGLPPDLYYLGILESGYVTKAISHAGAVGPWQFMGPTGRQYGLKINNYVDERTDPVRSTLAAIKYLKELYRLKKSWYMALAAYNAGPGRVRRAIRRGGSRNYWKLTRRRLLPYDTREYIPQFLAILSIGKNLQKYGFVERPEKDFIPRELVKVPSPIKLKKVAQLSGVDLDKIKSLNFHLKKDMTPPTKKKVYHLWIPKAEKDKVAGVYAQLKPHRIKGLKVYRPRRYMARARIHRVRKGQNLSTIARRYGTSVTKIKRLNRLRNNRIYVGQKLRVKGKAKRSVASTRRTHFHRVRRGENLSSIAKKYSLGVRELKRLNRIKGNRIMVGQKLKVYGKSRISKRKRNQIKRYRIRRGDNLYKIARRFGTTIRRIKKLNNLKTNRIMKGQTLVVASN